MLTFEDALAAVLALARPLSAQTVSVDESVGRAVNEAVLVRRTLPAFDVATMDGFAVRVADCPGTLTVVETLFAGQAPTVRLAPGQCARIMTGAALPEGADAVVMQEKTTHQGHHVTVSDAVLLGANIRRRGEDVEAGQILLAASRVVGLAEAGQLWSQGMTQVGVHRRPTVAIASSGDELCPVGVESDRLVDTNSPVLSLAARRAGGIVTPLGLAPDRLDAMIALFEKGLGHDVLLTVSGASVGDKDFTGEALKALGVDVEFWKVAMKPGKPLMVGRKGATVVFGLPGNPTSALVSFELFVRPALRLMQGLPPTAQPLVGRLDGSLSKSAGIRLFARSRATLREGEWWATPLASQSSGALASAAGATHLVSLAPSVTEVGRGDKVQLISVAWGE